MGLYRPRSSNRRTGATDHRRAQRRDRTGSLGRTGRALRARARARAPPARRSGPPGEAQRRAAV